LLAQLRRQPSAVLLAVQLIGLLVYPSIDGLAGRSAISLFGLLVLVLAVWSVDATPWTAWVSVLLGLPSLVFTIIQLVTGSGTWVGWASGFECAFYLYAAGSMIAYMLADHEITADELFAVGASFTLVAWAFAHLFVVTQIVWPGSFIAAQHPEQARTWMELLFLSFTTLTSTGLSDVVPVLPHARSFVMIEQLAGLGFVAMVVSRMVGLAIQRPRRSGD
jgi:hypothetical protein